MFFRQPERVFIMSISLFRSDRIEELVQKLADLIKNNPQKNIFLPIEILIASDGMKHFVNFSLAQKLGVASNIRYSKVHSFFWRILYEANKNQIKPFRHSYAPEILQWQILKIFQSDKIPETVKKAVDNYLKSHDTAAYGLAQTLAKLFEQYMIHRSDWIRAWSKNQLIGKLGKDEEWQKDFNYKETYPELHKLVASSTPKFTVNGTGRYVNHGFHSDASMTGRKLAVNNMSVGPVYSMCQCGGGSYIKPWHASDFLLPMVATWISKAVVDLGLTSYANVALACTIGSRSIDSFCITGDAKFNKDVKLRKLLTTALINYGISPDSLKDRWDLLDRFDFYKSELQNFVKTTGLYSNVPWYDTKDLVNYLRPIIDDGIVEQ